MNLKKILVIIVVIAGLVYFLLSSFFVDVQINKYEDLEVVKEQTAIQRGWIPAILPNSAFDIVETHDIDTNVILGSFSYKEKDEEKFLQKLTILNDADNTMEWEKFLFRVDTELNKVKFMNKPDSLQPKREK